MFSFHLNYKKSTGAEGSGKKDEEEPLVDIGDGVDGSHDNANNQDDGIQKLKLAPKKSALKKGTLKRYPSQG